MSHNLKTLVVTILAVVSCLSRAHISAAQTKGEQAAKSKTGAPATTKATPATPEKIAQSMVKVYRDNRYTHPFWAMTTDIGDDGTAAVTRLVKVGEESTGESHSGMEALSLISAYRGWLVSRRPLKPEIVAKYEARFKKIDKTTLEAWQDAANKISDGSNSKVLLLAAIAFQDFLFDGSEWKRGNPQRALMRLGSLPPDVVSRWKAAAKASDGLPEEKPYAAWSLLAIDDLFTNNGFQTQVFDSAFPIAEKLLSAH